MNPFFSIIIPTYNRAQLLTKAIDSVRQQTFPDWELVIVDDGSTDNTKDLIRNYSLWDERIKYIHQKNSERSAARNNGIEKAKGKYVCFLDSDDYFLPFRLELLFNELETRNFPVAAFFTGLIIEKDETTFLEVDPVPSGNIFEHLVLSSIHSQQTCIHHIVINKLKYDTRFRIGEDLELWLRIANEFPFLYLEKQLTVVVVDHEERSVNIKKHNFYLDNLKLLNYIFSNSIYSKEISCKVKNRVAANCYYGIAKYNIYKVNRVSALLFMAKSIITDMDSPLKKFRVNVFLKLAMGFPIRTIKSLIE